MGANVYFPHRCGGILPADLGAGERSQQVRGGSAINVQGDGAWRITLDSPLPASKRLVTWGPVGNTPPGGVSLEFVEVDDSTFYISVNDLTGTLINTVPISFFVQALPVNT